MSERIYQPKPGTLLYKNLVNDIEEGQLKIPQFQRKFVWTIEETAGLIDSILKGYPIGTFIVWKTQERLRSIRNIGNIELPETKSGDMVHYVLDGQQRMTSIYIAMKGLTISVEDGRQTDYSNIYIDLTVSPDQPIVITDTTGLEEKNIIKLKDLLNGKIQWLAQNYIEHLETIDLYKNAIQTYQFSTIEVENAPIDIATEIFTRINVKGKTLSLFDIMVAKTYSDERDFDLSEKYDELIERLERKMNYETISNSTVLQAVSACMVKECTKKRILGLDRFEFIEAWDKVIYAFESAVDYFHSYYRIPVSQLLPYDALLVPFTYYFYHHKDKPLGMQQKRLQDMFWRTVLTSRYSSGTENKLGQDIKRVDEILADKQPRYDEAVNITVESLKNRGWFSAGTAFIKGMLCLLAYQQPKSFVDNSLVTINNAWLKQANSKNYHHFFPKSYMRKNHPETDDWLVNHIANITIVDDFMNKRKIRDRAPSLYIREFQDKNTALSNALASHLIAPPEECGIFDDDYDKFFMKRLEAYHKELMDRLILTEMDSF